MIHAARMPPRYYRQAGGFGVSGCFVFVSFRFVFSFYSVLRQHASSPQQERRRGRRKRRRGRRRTHERCVIQSGDLASVRRIGQLRDKDRAGLGEETGEKTQDRSRGDESVHVVCQTLHDGESNACDDTNGNSRLAPETIGEISDQKQRNHFTSRIHRVHGAEHRALGVAKVGSPLRQRLKAVHHGPWNPSHIRVSMAFRVVNNWHM